MISQTARWPQMLKMLTTAVFRAGVFTMTALPGCGVYMEATRPTPVDLAQFTSGQPRDMVREELGTPQGNASEADGAACDFYNLYTHGYGTGGKVGLAFLEGAADVFTLGAAEVVNTPVEGATRNQTHPVTFCYKDGKLARITESGHQILSEGSTTSEASATAPTNPPGRAQTSIANLAGTTNISSTIAALPAGQSAAIAHPALPAAVASQPVEAPSASTETTSYPAQ
jgi:hypothetical protein